MPSETVRAANKPCMNAKDAADYFCRHAPLLTSEEAVKFFCERAVCIGLGPKAIEDATTILAARFPAELSLHRRLARAMHRRGRADLLG